MEEMKFSIAPPLPVQAREHIEKLILAGRYRPGEKINEADLAADLGLSRSPVREALQVLATQGLVTLRPNRGPFVTTFTPEAVTQLFEVREAINGMAARLTCIRNDFESIRTIEEHLNEAQHILDGDPASGYPLQPDFHELVLEASGNEQLAAVGRPVEARLRLARLLSAGRRSRASDALAEHWQVFEAIRSGVPGRAEEAMRAHIRSSQAIAAEIFSLAAESDSSAAPR